MVDHFDVMTPLRFLLCLRKLQTADTNADSVDNDEDAANKNCIDDNSYGQSYNNLLCMESHYAKRQNTLIWHQHRRSVIDPMRQIGLYEHFCFKRKYINDDFMQKICGILDVNSFDVRTPTSQVRQCGEIFNFQFFLQHIF